MDFRFNEEEELFKRSVREFCDKHIAPVWVDLDEKRYFPAELYKKMADQGLFGIAIKPEYGGPGGTMVMAAIAVEETAYADPSVAIPVYTLLQNGWPLALQVFGSEEAKSEILPKVIKNEAFFGIATTESQGGSDLAGTRVTADKKGDTWTLNGEKMYISGVGELKELPWGGGFWVLARTGSPDQGHKALTSYAFLPKKEGKTVEGYEPTIMDEIGRGGLTTGGFNLTNVEVDDKYRIGDINKGFYLSMEGFNIARILVAAACIGAGRWALDQAVEWFKQRKLFGKHISAFQGVSFKFAELYAQLEAAKYFVYKAAWMADKIYIEKDPAFKPMDLNLPASMAKLTAPEACIRALEETMKWHGAYGYSKECPLYRAWLGCFSYVIGAEGAQNIMRYIVARDVIGKEYME
ncbi:MAG: acyl-CoA dehydrogenase family protein [Candidatus Methanoperedens sp.]|nr:acyl-CoA dehydrogenase family protein [Candidatus Methanoperedens sp.]